MRFSTLLLVVFLLRGMLLGQLTTVDTADEAGQVRFGIATTMVGGFLAGSLVMSYNDWWKGSALPFHFVREGFFHDYSLGIDKIGHAYTSYLYFHTIRDLLSWGGYSPSSAFWLGASGACMFGLLIEVGDGFSPYGFSWEDETANLVGLGFGMLQITYPFLEKFQFKWSYIPRGRWSWPPHFTDHYDWHTYWLAVNMHRLLPESLARYWPEFIQLAVGYGADRGQTKREFVIGLDFNLCAFTTRNSELRLLERVSSRFHFPAPGVKLTEDGAPKSYLLHLN